MSVADDFDPVAEEARREQARALVRSAVNHLQELRIKTALLHSGDQATWQDARYLAQKVIRESDVLELPLLVACAKEVLHFAEQRFAGGPPNRLLVLYMLTALDTLDMELERLRHDRGLR